MGKEKRREIPRVPDNEHGTLSRVSPCYANFRKQWRDEFSDTPDARRGWPGGSARVAKRARKELISQDVTSFLALAIGNSGSC
ncbi:hypothetical protein K0M31_000241 [Melipona bicolor]|uniref:Uncharacterized protein n=1 Tax=Melipona bicolor TaxID=60889 RepID=A0AA40GDW6_9HYME|nr:hypothetical protein K0M31_000241 [Melipona bicolor]